MCQLENIIIANNGVEIEAINLYSDLFQFDKNYIQFENGSYNDLKANPLGYGKNFKNKTGNYRVLFIDTFKDSLEFLQKKDFAITNGISYFGRKNLQSHASKMFAMIIDLDGVDEQGLKNFFFGAGNNVYPIPNYIALSGHGLHFYYLFEEPVSLYPNIKTQLKDLKYALMRLLWNKSISSEYQKVQYQGINQGFRVIGGKTKIKDKYVRAFKIHDKKTSPNKLASYVSYETKFDSTELWKKAEMSLEKAKKAYPEWYERVVLNKESLNGGWTCKPDLYNWWLRRIKAEAVVGHRYYCVMCLAIYAIKSGIDYETLKADAYSLLDKLNEVKDADPFLESDIESALECYDLKYLRFPIKDISKISALEIVKNKRNGRSQEVHIKTLNAMRKFRRDELDEDEYKNNGRKSKQEQVQKWKLENPNSSKYQCQKELGLSKNTVKKWWN